MGAILFIKYRRSSYDSIQEAFQGSIQEMRELATTHPNTVLISISFVVGIITIGSYVYLNNKKSRAIDKKLKSNDNKGEKSSTVSKKTSMKPVEKLKNIFDFNRENGTQTTNTSSKTGKNEERPFESSYYYAHNGLKGGGGYSDGLKTEDYTMNQPRLLSKGKNPPNPTKATTNGTSAAENGSKIKKSPSKPVNGSVQLKPKTVSRVPTPITKYLFDDSSDVAKIRIDTLPCTKSSTTTTTTTTNELKWEDANIVKSGIHAKLINDSKGMILILNASSPPENEKPSTCYSLHVPSLYDAAETVSTIWKKNRLIVKVVKRKKGAWSTFTGASVTKGGALPPLPTFDDCGDLYKNAGLDLPNLPFLK
eukprot:CAMPEP_0194417278 /NCGR_PEP_ID=MMETSP0176-20130528/16334_1 /TAXON_ID=216777 /ORGANISM="Proboscia alata, Strain PI-D3" /LENGTH=364 /DNA_ID=CAMNT_0039223057 /DNA_START=91 /DNA_END=1185 /DNA_ORIENTATION=+